MGEYEPRDSRNVTLKQERAPGEPPRTGPREHETRFPDAAGTELAEDGRGEDAERSVTSEQQDALQRERAIESDTSELNEAEAARRGSER